MPPGIIRILPSHNSLIVIDFNGFDYVGVLLSIQYYNIYHPCMYAIFLQYPTNASVCTIKMISPISGAPVQEVLDGAL